MEYLELRIGFIESLIGSESNENIKIRLENIINTVKSIKLVDNFLHTFDSYKGVLNGDLDDSISTQDKLTLINLFDNDIPTLDYNLRQIDLLSEFNGDLGNLINNSNFIRDLNTQLHEISTQLEIIEPKLYHIITTYNNSTNQTSNEFIKINNDLNILDLQLKRFEFMYNSS